MNIAHLLLLLFLSAKTDKSELDGKWGIAYFETPVDSVLLAGNPNLVLEGMCYGSNHGSNYGLIYGPEYRAAMRDIIKSSLENQWSGKVDEHHEIRVTANLALAGIE